MGEARKLFFPGAHAHKHAANTHSVLDEAHIFLNQRLMWIRKSSGRISYHQGKLQESTFFSFTHTAFKLFTRNCSHR